MEKDRHYKNDALLSKELNFLAWNSTLIFSISPYPHKKVATRISEMLSLLPPPDPKLESLLSFLDRLPLPSLYPTDRPQTHTLSACRQH